MKWEKFDIRNLSEAEYQKWYSLMSDENKSRVDRFRFAEDKRLTVAGEMIAKKMIAKCCCLQPENIIFDKTDGGKPFAVGLNIHFNISHSGNFVVCATDKNPVGIDIEKKQAYNPSIAKRICSDEETTLLEGSKNPSEEFIKLWTAKEAYGKFLGKGLTEEIFKANLPIKPLQYEFDDYYVSIIKT